MSCAFGFFGASSLYSSRGVSLIAEGDNSFTSSLVGILILTSAFAHVPPLSPGGQRPPHVILLIRTFLKRRLEQSHRQMPTSQSP